VHVPAQWVWPSSCNNLLVLLSLCGHGHEQLFPMPVGPGLNQQAFIKSSTHCLCFAAPTACSAFIAGKPNSYLLLLLLLASPAVFMLL
jgi:hypothetical protein